ncbi:MAG: hypothetical protein AABX07_04750 [Nanoarchaeota archaeon]
MEKRGFIAAIIILIIAGGIIFSAIYLSAKKTENSSETADFENIANTTKITEISNNSQEEESSCISNSDCVPASCCHPSKCTSLDKAPNCKGAFCTMECSPETLDCGQGSCACINDKCEAVFK